MERTRTTTLFRTEMRASRARFVRYDPRGKERRLRTMRENADLRGKSSSDSKDVVEEEEDAVGERAEKTVLLQYKNRRERFREDVQELMQTLTSNLANMIVLRQIVSAWVVVKKRFESYDENFRKWQFLKTQQRWAYEQESEPERRFAVESLKFVTGFLLLVGYEVLCPGQSIFWAVVFPAVMCWVVVQKWFPKPLLACYVVMLPLKLPPFLPIRLL